MKVKCALKGCKSVFQSSDVPSPNGVRYVCSHHSDEELRAAEILQTERTDRNVHFQAFAFDKGLKSAKTNRYYTKALPLSPEFPTSSILVKED